jgi:hypothetical protein
MMTDDVRRPAIRRTKAVRLVEHARGISVYPEPYSAPVLPGGWAPLDRADQEAVLAVCDAHPESCRFRVVSPWDASIEYRVYALETEAWHGVCTATAFKTDPVQAGSGQQAFGNVRLLAIAREVQTAARIAVDFVNWDLEAEGLPWRLEVAAAESAS